MAIDRYERMRIKLFGGHTQNPFEPLLRDRSRISGPVQGTPEEFSQVLYELGRGDLKRRSDTVSYEFVAEGRKCILKFRDGSLFRAVKAKGKLGNPVIVVSPHLYSMEDLLESREMPLSHLVTDGLLIREPYAQIALEYSREERRLATEKAEEEAQIFRESKIEAVVAVIERATSGETIMVRGQQNIEALVGLGFVPGLVENPDNWIDAEDFPGLRYRHGRSGVELLLIGREKFRPIEEPSRLEFTFLVHRSDDAPTAYARMLRKFRQTGKEGATYSLQAFLADLVRLVKYPEELKGRTEEDLGLMADEVENVIDRRQVLDKGILPYEAVFTKNTRAIIEHIIRQKMPAGEVRKALDYCEYTGMIDQAYKATLEQEIAAATAIRPAEAQGPGDVLYDKRVKEIVAEVLRKIPKERLTSKTITIALTPYVSELGFSRLVKIRERILELKEMVHDQQKG